MLQLFEIISVLEVNFHKSLLLGINVGVEWLNEAASFLNCKVGSFLLYTWDCLLGQMLEQKNATLQPVVDKVRGRLQSWNSQHLTLGGKIILLKAVLNALPVYFLSFFKAPEAEG